MPFIQRYPLFRVSFSRGSGGEKWEGWREGPLYVFRVSFSRGSGGEKQEGWREGPLYKGYSECLLAEVLGERTGKEGGRGEGRRVGRRKEVVGDRVEEGRD